MAAAFLWVKAVPQGTFAWRFYLLAMHWGKGHALGHCCLWVLFQSCSISRMFLFWRQTCPPLCLLPGGFGGKCLSPTATCQSWALPTLACSTEVCCSHGNLPLQRAADVYVEFILGTEVGVLLCDMRDSSCLLLYCSSVAGLQSTAARTCGSR